MTTTNARNDILKRIGDALSFRPAEAATIVTDCDAPNGIATEARSELIHKFEQELAAVGGVTHRVPNAAAACVCVLGIASEHKVRKAIVWDVELIRGLDLTTALGEAGVELLTAGGASELPGFGVAATADIGITTVDYALADTGTIVLRSGTAQNRVTSLLPPVHVAFLRPEQIVSGVDELFPLLDRERESTGRLDSAVTFITGPSRTADIELTLVVGVHGPQELHVILLEEDDSARK